MPTQMQHFSFEYRTTAARGLDFKGNITILTCMKYAQTFAIYRFIIQHRTVG
jgi:hypothetical protein